MSRLPRVLRWLLLATALAIASLFLTFKALALVDFGYPVWHSTLGIDATIARYAPQNRYRDGFARTTLAERTRLFGRIVDAIQHDGRGLRTLAYHAPDVRVLGRLLRPPEIQHLHDVARLVRWFQWAGWVALAVLLALVAWSRRRGERRPRTRWFAFGYPALLVLAAVPIVLFGPTAVFYWLHRHIFPPGHEWFFWYRDSLMSTMMQAPDLFGAIAVVWLTLALLLGAAGLWALGRWLDAS